MRSLLLIVLLILEFTQAIAAEAPVTTSLPDNGMVVQSLPDTPNTTPSTASGVYKWVDDQGVTHYGDKPPSTEMTPVELPNIQIIESTAVEIEVSTTPVPTTTTAASPQPAIAANYQINVVSPRHNDTVTRNDNKQIFVSISINVPLLMGDRVVLVVDGTRTQTEGSGGGPLSIQSGQHTLQAIIVNEQDQVLAQSAIHSFRVVDSSWNKNDLINKTRPTSTPTAQPTSPPIDFGPIPKLKGIQPEKKPTLQPFING